MKKKLVFFAELTANLKQRENVVDLREQNNPDDAYKLSVNFCYFDIGVLGI